MGSRENIGNNHIVLPNGHANAKNTASTKVEDIALGAEHGQGGRLTNSIAFIKPSVLKKPWRKPPKLAY